MQINAETGARAQIGDQNVIWEAFTVGTEPTENMYILDGTGINLVNNTNSYYDYDSIPEYEYDSEASPFERNDSLYEIYGRQFENDPESAPRLDNEGAPYQPSPAPQPQQPETDVGTGGLY